MHESWPFEDQAWDVYPDWWEKCFLPEQGGPDAILAGHKHWSVLLGGIAGGKSVTLAAYRKRLGDKPLIVDYPAAEWSAGAHKPHDNHLAQIMTKASKIIRDHITEQPEWIDELSENLKQYVRWLIEKFNGNRAYYRWLDGLPKSYEKQFLEISYHDRYPSQTLKEDVQGQLEELINLCRRLGKTELVILIDVANILNDAQAEQLRHMFQWLELMHHDGFRCVSAMNERIQEHEGLFKRARGRITAVRIPCSTERSWMIVNQHLNASNSHLFSIEELASQGLLTKLGAIITKEYACPAPGAWVSLSGILLELASQSELPLDEGYFAEIEQAYYKQNLPLTIQPGSNRAGVWRGANFITLDPVLWEFVQKLCQSNGGPVDYQKFNKSKENMHTIALRLRKALEPNREHPIYLVKEANNEGYWLNNFVVS